MPAARPCPEARACLSAAQVLGRSLHGRPPTPARYPCPLPQTHFILDEMLMNGCVVETNKSAALAPVQLLEKAP